MSASFASQLRVRNSEIVRLAPEGAPALRVRVESADSWNTVRVDATANTSVMAVKEAAMRTLHSGTEHLADYVVKLRGWEILDEQQSLGQAGVVDGATLLVHSRRKRPVR
ncbi:MAG TPA: hypothetical protein VFT96_06000 [Gemmatimonadaceae bacterium]|nr:hypothetical protein [Gemmatimonadaceae bacterium]